MDAQEPRRSPWPVSENAERAPVAAPTHLRPVEQQGEEQQGEATPNECASCGRDYGADVACQFCKQVAGLPRGVVLASPARRLGGYLMEGVLFVVTLGIGYLIWWVVVLGRGQTPGKQVLGMRVLRLQSVESAGWGLMFFREVVAKGLIGILSLLTLGITNFWLLWDSNRQELWDKLASTIVVDDRAHQLG